MNARILLLAGCAVIGAPLTPLAAKPEDSVVKVLVSARYPDITRPWTKGNTLQTYGTGVVIDGKRILTNAHVVRFATEIYIESRTGEEKIEASLVALGPDVDLALIAVKDDGFFAKHPALPSADKLPWPQESVAVFGFPVGGTELAVTKGEIARIAFSDYGTRGMGRVYQITAAINPGNSGGPAVANGKMIGLVFSRPPNLQQIGLVIPNEEIEQFLSDCKGGRYQGKAMDATGTWYYHLENDALRRMLHVGPAVKGVVARPPRHRDADYPLHELDVITKIGGHEVDNTGTVQWTDGQRVPIMYAMSKQAQLGPIPLTVLRQGKVVETALPVSHRDHRVLRAREEETPSYFIHGPLVFATARTDDIPALALHNKSMAQDNSPLITRALDCVAFAGEELVVVCSPMFSHKIAKGYQNPIGKVVKSVNGVRIKNLRHLVETLRDATDEFLRIEFADDWSDRLVFDRQGMERATEEILEDNGILPTRRGSPELLKVWQTGGTKR
jgi:S1-C subfamily serine protease